MSEQDQIREADLLISDPAFFRDILKAVAVVNDEAWVILDPEGIRIKNMSLDNVVMVDLYIPRAYFWDYNVYEERVISFNVKDLLRMVFKRGKMKDTSILMRIEAERIVFDIKLGTGVIRKTLPLFGPLEEEAQPQEMHFKSKVKILTNPLIRAIEDAKTLENSDTVLITFEDNEISFSVIDGDYAVENIYEQYADEILYYRTDGTHKTHYTIKRLLPIIKVLKPITETITLELSTDYPIRITPGLPIDGHLIYHLAPCTSYKEKEPEPVEDQEVEQAAPEVDDIVVYTVDPQDDPAPVEIPAVEAAPMDVPMDADPDPQEAELSLGDLYLKYYAEALARHTAEAV